MVFQAAAAVFAATRLLRLGLARNQPALLLFLSLSAISNFALSPFPLGSPRYFWSYLALQSIADLVLIAVVRELFSTAVSGYPGIRTAGRWILYGAVTLSVVVCLVVTVVSWGKGADGRGNLFYFLVVHRGIQLGLALSIVFQFFFLSRYPLDLHRNTLISGYLFTAVFLIDAAYTLVGTLSPHLFSRPVGMAETVLIGFCFLSWAALLSREEAVARKIRFKTAEDLELLRQLESLNQTLSRVGRR